MVGGDELRRTMRNFPSGISVMTIALEGQRAGVTVGSLVSLSLTPPLVGVSIGRELAVHELLRDAGGFGVSMLRGEQAALAAHFARGVPPIALWEGLAVRDGSTGVPLLADALAWLECRIVDEHAVGDHTLFVGEVLSVELGENAPPLVHVESGFRSL
jgi:flavin reductase (DIM6/NTAB) family NADH-FMN oxidoreductase RutF